MIKEEGAGRARRVVIEHDELEVAILPERGGKIETLRRRAGKAANMLLPIPQGFARETMPHDGDPYGMGEAWGHDECFPTVAASVSPDDSSLKLPDHGELWSAPWTIERDGDAALLMEVRGRRLPYLFRRRLEIRGAALRLDYEVQSESDEAMTVMWSAHTLLAACPGSRVVLPKEVDSLLVNASAGDRLGKFGERCAWPLHAGQRLDVLAPPGAGTADKLFTDKLSEGRCAFYHQANDESVVFRFDVAQTPYLGVWISADGWPDGAGAKQYAVALEPCAGRPDELLRAGERGEAQTLNARSSQRWSVEIELRAGSPVFD